MNKEKKLEILNKLIKDGNLELSEALILLETEKEYLPCNCVSNPFIYKPYVNPYNNAGVANPDWTYRPGLITFTTIGSNCNGNSCTLTSCTCKN